MDAGVRCTEVYFRQRGHLVWPQVLEAVQELIGAAPCCSFVPKSRDGGLGISVRWRAGELVGASAVAREATLPPDFELQRRWLSTLSSDDAAVFTRACQSVAALGVPAGRHFLGVAWTLLSSGRQTQAAYFRVPPRLESIPC